MGFKAPPFDIRIYEFVCVDRTIVTDIFPDTFSYSPPIYTVPQLVLYIELYYCMINNYLSLVNPQKQLSICNFSKSIIPIP